MRGRNHFFFSFFFKERNLRYAIFWYYFSVWNWFHFRQESAVFLSARRGWQISPSLSHCLCSANKDGGIELWTWAGGSRKTQVCIEEEWSAPDWNMKLCKFLSLSRRLSLESGSVCCCGSRATYTPTKVTSLTCESSSSWKFIRPALVGLALLHYAPCFGLQSKQINCVGTKKKIIIFILIVYARL